MEDSQHLTHVHAHARTHNTVTIVKPEGGVESREGSLLRPTSKLFAPSSYLLKEQRVTEHVLQHGEARWAWQFHRLAMRQLDGLLLSEVLGRQFMGEEERVKDVEGQSPHLPLRRIHVVLSYIATATNHESNFNHKTRHFLQRSLSL